MRTIHMNANIFVFSGTASSLIEIISSSVTEAKWEAMLFFFGGE